MSERSRPDAAHNLIAVNMLQPIEDGEVFEHWPLHITLMSWFRSPINSAIDAVHQTACRSAPFPVRVGEQEKFGKDIDVYLVEPATLVHALHTILAGELENREVLLPRTQFIGEYFRPHVTVQENGPAIIPGQTLKIDHIAILRKHQTADNSLLQAVHVEPIRIKRD